MGDILDMRIKPRYCISNSLYSKDGRREGTYDFKKDTAESTFFIPTFTVLCSICRCRFDTSTSSPSTIPSIPTPDPAMYAAAGHPSPPVPITRTFDFFSLSCPGLSQQKLRHAVSQDTTLNQNDYERKGEEYLGCPH